MINAKELRKKYMKDYIIPVKMTECLESIEKQIIEAAQNGEDSIVVKVPSLYKNNIKEELENEDYTVASGIVGHPQIEIDDNWQYITIFLNKDLVYFDELIG